MGSERWENVEGREMSKGRVRRGEVGEIREMIGEEGESQWYEFREIL